MLKIKQAIIVEGRYDKAVLENIIDAVIIPVNGFGIYKDKHTLNLIKRYAQETGIIILTDSDNAGRQIRNYIKNYLPKDCEIIDIYVPNLHEVEDTNADVLRKIFTEFKTDNKSNNPAITRERLFDDGLIGSANSAEKRKALLKQMNLPENLSTAQLINVLNLYDIKEYEKWYSQV
ncbi:MAG: DUF4093 domain-containing protein [Oscillospiraceae bacterium]|nr:DUF4093 domain-containing protein [Oscillospiraceae bacterium]